MKKVNLEDIVEIPVHAGTVFKKPLIATPMGRGKVATYNFARLPKGNQLTVHKHTDGEEYYLFQKGSGEMLIGNDWIPVDPGDFVVVPVDHNHSLKSETSDMEFITLRTILT